METNFLKKLLLGVVLLTSCSPSLTEEPVEDPIVEVTPDDDTCIDLFGNVSDPQTEYEATLVEATKETEEGRWYELIDWNLKFLIPSEYEEFNVFASQDSYGSSYIIEATDRSECLSVGDAGAFVVGFYKADYLDSFIYTNLEEALAEYSSPYSEERDFSTNYFDFKELKEQGLGDSEMIGNFFLHDGAVFGIGSSVCEECCKGGKLMLDMLRHIQPIEVWEGGIMESYAHQMAQSYLSFGAGEEFTIEADEDNYYAEVRGSWDGSATLAVFIQANGEHLLALSILRCGPLCHQSLYFLEPYEGGWKEVTEEVFPAFTEEELIELAKTYSTAEGDFNGLYVLPHYGTAIEFINQYKEMEGDKEVIATFEWKNSQFVRN
jgi:hypothetical protein